MRIKFSPESVQDLQRLHDFISRHDPDAARTAVLNLQSAINRFSDMPGMGRPVQDMSPVREFIFGRYVIRYLVKEEAVYILRLWHSKKNR